MGHLSAACTQPTGAALCSGPDVPLLQTERAGSVRFRRDLLPQYGRAGTGTRVTRGGRSTPTQSGAGRLPAAGPGLTLAVVLLPVGGDGGRRVLLVLLPRSVVLLLHVEALVALHLGHLQVDTPGRTRPRNSTPAPGPTAPGVAPATTGPARPPQRPRAAAGRAAQAAVSPRRALSAAAAQKRPPRGRAEPNRGSATTAASPGGGHGSRCESRPPRPAAARRGPRARPELAHPNRAPARHAPIGFPTPSAALPLAVLAATHRLAAAGRDRPPQQPAPRSRLAVRAVAARPVRCQSWPRT